MDKETIETSFWVGLGLWFGRALIGRALLDLFSKKIDEGIEKAAEKISAKLIEKKKDENGK